MAARFSILTLAVIVFVFLPLGTASAEVRAQSACSLYPSSLFANPPRMSSTSEGRCFSGDHRCFVGVRGDWLDLTGSVDRVSGPSVGRIDIDKTGVEDSGSLSGDCIPRSNKDREGFVRLILEDIEGAGTLRLRLNRPGGQDTISVTVLDGKTFLGTKLEGNFADTGVSKVFNLKGANLGRLRMKQVNRVSGLTSNTTLNTVDLPTRSLGGSESDGILDSTPTTARVRLTFHETGTVSLETRLEFEGGEPELNERLGWPSVTVRRPGGGGNQNPPPPPQPGAGGTPGTNVGSTPNLTPNRLFNERPLLRKVNTLSSLMVPSFFCAGLAIDEEREVDVPAFEWGVANDNRTAITQPFAVAVLNGAGGNAPLAAQTVTTLPQSDIRTFRNWPGRPARVKVVNVQSNRLMSEYNNSAGCYIPNALAGRVTLDPKPLIIRADSASQIAERVETDNDLVIP